MAGAPIQITLYGEDNEVKQTYTRMFVPWKLLKVAVRLQKSINPEAMNEEDVNAIAALVCEVFGGQFSIEDLNNGADIGEMMTVLQAIISRTTGALPNGLAGRK